MRVNATGTMANIPSLKRFSCLVTVQALLNIREDTSTSSASKLIRLFQTDSYTGMFPVADPGFSVGGRGRRPRRGRQLLRWLRFEKFVYQNERIWTLGGCAPAAPPPLDPPMVSF